MTRPSKGGSKYERIRRLGTDGPFMVEVAWPREQRDVHQAVLLKRLRPGWPVSSQALNRFMDDTRLISKLSHPNIVRVLDITKDEKGPFIVTEYIHGVSLAAVLRQIRRKNLSLPLAHALSIARQACVGLKTAQAAGEAGRGVIHGAISPEHLMISFEGAVKCKDFGIFRLYPSDQRESLGGPNPVYLSVEQEQGLQPNIRSDLYSLGRVFQKLLSLSTEGSLKQLPGKILQILSDLLKADPAQRPRSVAAAEQALMEVVRSHGSDEQGHPAQLGAFVRGMFETETTKPTTKPEVEADRAEASSQDVSLLDPAIFWVGGDQEMEAAADDTTPTLEEEALEQEVSGEAVVVSVPVGQPKELFLPESERIVVTPTTRGQPGQLRGAAPGVGSAPAPSMPQEDLKKIGKPKKAPFLVAGIAASVFLLAVIAVWSLSGDGKPGMTQDASAAGPVPAGGEKTRPPVSEETAVVSKDPEPPRPVDAKTGTLKLSSNPPGALVYINEKKTGVTPITVRGVAVGSEVSIRVELEDHRPWTQSVVLDEKNLVREFEAGLLKNEVCGLGIGWVYVATEPEGGTVEFDGKRLPGKTPMIINDVCAGVQHEIRVQARGFRAWRKKIKVSPQKVLNLNIELER